MRVHIQREEWAGQRRKKSGKRERERGNQRSGGGESERYQRDRNFNRDMLHFCPEQKQVALLVLNKY